MQSAGVDGARVVAGEAPDARRLLADRLEPLLGELEVGEPGRQADPQAERVHDRDGVAARLAQRGGELARARARAPAG